MNSRKKAQKAKENLTQSRKGAKLNRNRTTSGGVWRGKLRKAQSKNSKVGESSFQAPDFCRCSLDLVVSVGSMLLNIISII